MSASIFSFARARQAPAVRPKSDDWTTQELAELYRVCDRLVEAGFNISLHRGLTDEHEPWAVFERDDSHDVMVHIARIDGCLVVVNTTTGQEYHGVDFRAVTEQMLRDAPLAKPRQKDDDKVVYHPRAVFTAFVAAAIVVTELTRNVEQAEAAGVTVDEEAVSQIGIFSHLMARVFSRETGSPLHGFTGGTAAFGALGAAAIAIDLMASDLGAAESGAGDMSLDVTTVPEAGDKAVKSVAPREGGGEPASDGDLVAANSGSQISTEMDALNAMLTLDNLRLPENVDEAEAVENEKIDEKEMLLAQLDREKVARAEKAAQSETVELSGDEPSQADSPRQSSSQTVSSSSSTDSNHSSSEQSQDDEPTSAEPQKPDEPTVLDAKADESDDGALVLAGIFDQDKLGTIRFKTKKPDEDGEPGEDEVSAVLVLTEHDFDDEAVEHAADGIRHRTSEMNNTAALTDDVDVIVYDGGNATFTNFEFERDMLVIAGDEFLISSQESYVDGNDVHIIGIDGGMISLLDSFHTLQ